MLELMLFKGKSFFSKLIEFTTWGKYSHAAIYNTETKEIIESWHHDGVRIVDIKNHKHSSGTKVDIYTIKPNFNKEIFWENINREVGKKYDLLGIFSFIARKDLDEANKWFCSELIFAFLDKAGVPPLNPLNCPAYKVSPTLLSYSPMFEYKETITLF